MHHQSIEGVALCKGKKKEDGGKGLRTKHEDGALSPELFGRTCVYGRCLRRVINLPTQTDTESQISFTTRRNDDAAGRTGDFPDYFCGGVSADDLSMKTPMLPAQLPFSCEHFSSFRARRPSRLRIPATLRRDAKTLARPTYASAQLADIYIYIYACIMTVYMDMYADKSIQRNEEKEERST